MPVRQENVEMRAQIVNAIRAANKPLTPMQIRDAAGFSSKEQGRVRYNIDQLWADGTLAAIRNPKVGKPVLNRGPKTPLAGEDQSWFLTFVLRSSI